MFLERDNGWLACRVQLRSAWAFAFTPGKALAELDIAWKLVQELYAVRAIEILSAIDRLAREGALDFGDTADFIWKAPTLIERQTEIEKAKLQEYFPNDMRMRLLRWRFESRKLEHLFPLLMSTGNVFAVVSLFETYLLRLCT